MQYYYNGAIPPQTQAKAQAAAVANPAAAKHIASVWQFVGWLKDANPDMYYAITGTRPDLLDPADVVHSGTLSPASKKDAPTTQPAKSALKGLFDSGQFLFTSNDQSQLQTPAGLTSSSTYTDPGVPTYAVTVGDHPDTATTSSWASQLLDFGKQYITLDAQKKLLDTNLKRAEQGLPPIDNVGAAVNVGITSDVQKVLMLAIGGAVLVGVAAVISKRR